MATPTTPTPHNDAIPTTSLIQEVTSAVATVVAYAQGRGGGGGGGGGEEKMVVTPLGLGEPSSPSPTIGLSATNSGGVGGVGGVKTAVDVKAANPTTLTMPAMDTITTTATISNDDNTTPPTTNTTTSATTTTTTTATRGSSFIGFKKSLVPQSCVFSQT